MTAPNLPPGHVVAAKYSVQALLGHGGSTATYRVMDAHRRELAMKLFDPAIAQRADVMSAIERLYGGINALPGELVFPILDAGYDPSSGAPYCITELSQNPSLAQMTAQRPLSQQEALALLQSMARVLDTAHSRQVLHHALKPANVFVSPPQGFAARISDFGAGMPRGVVPTQEGYSLAAPWMAPEQLQGNPAPGPAADVFSTALVVFAAMTGRSYWRSCQGGAPDLGGWQREIMSPRMPPSARAAELGVPLHPMLDPVLGRALAPDPAERFQSVGEFAAAFSSATNAPEAANTVAFPSVNVPDMPVGGPGGASAGAGGPYPVPGSPLAGPGGPPAGPGGPGAGPPADGGYPPAPAPAADPSGLRAAPTQLPQHLAQPAASSKLMPILVAAGAVVLIGGGVAAYFILGGSSPPEPDGPIAIAPASATQGATNAGASAAAAPPKATAAPPAASSAPAAPAGSEVKVTCSPGPCDEIQIDDRPIDMDAGPPTVGPGMHKVKVSKAGFFPQFESFTAKPGENFEKEFTLAPIPKATGPAQPTTTKKCGTFINPCK